MRKYFEDMNQLQGFKYILAVSGGVDSMVMLDLFFQEFGSDQLVVAHLDHMIRPDSGADMEVVREYCAERQIEFVGERIDVTKFPGNLEANARQVRYNFLEKVRRDYGADWIVTAHHLDDQTETIMMSSLKGSFVSGLSGMDVVDEGRKLLRPMLFVRKQDLLNYSKVRNVRFVVDETNRDVRYDRNFLRNDIFPKLEERFPGFVERYSEMADFYAELDLYLHERADKWVDNNCDLEDYGWTFERDDFLELPAFMRFMVLQKLSMQRVDLKMSRANFSDIDQMIFRGNSGKMKEVGDYYVYLYEGSLLVSRYDIQELQDWYWAKCLREFNDEIEAVKDDVVPFCDGMKVVVEYGNEHGQKEVLLKQFLKQQNVPWFFRKGVPVLLNKIGMVERCWVL
jgi:tRNA(Ile)-lysidine synthase